MIRSYPCTFKDDFLDLPIRNNNYPSNGSDESNIHFMQQLVHIFSLVASQIFVRFSQSETRIAHGGQVLPGIK